MFTKLSEYIPGSSAAAMKRAVNFEGNGEGEDYEVVPAVEVRALVKAGLRESIGVGIETWNVVNALGLQVRRRISSLLALGSDRRSVRYNVDSGLLEDGMDNYVLLKSLSHILLGRDGEGLSFNEQMYRVAADCINQGVEFTRVKRWIESCIPVVVKQTLEDYFLTDRMPISAKLRRLRLEVVSWYLSLMSTESYEDYEEDLDCAVARAVETYDPNNTNIWQFLKYLEGKFPNVNLLEYISQYTVRGHFEELLGNILADRLREAYADQVPGRAVAAKVEKFVSLMLSDCLFGDTYDQGKIAKLYGFAKAKFVIDDNRTDGHKASNDRIDIESFRTLFAKCMGACEMYVGNKESEFLMNLLPMAPLQIDVRSMFANPTEGLADYKLLAREYDDDQSAVLDRTVGAFGCEDKEGFGDYLRELYRFLTVDLVQYLDSVADRYGKVGAFRSDFAFPDVPYDVDFVDVYFQWVSEAAQGGLEGFEARRRVTLLQLAHVMKKSISAGEVARTGLFEDVNKWVNTNLRQFNGGKEIEVHVKSKTSLFVKLLRGGCLEGVNDVFRLQIVSPDDEYDELVDRFNAATLGTPVVQRVKDKRGTKINKDSAADYEDVTFEVRVPTKAGHVTVEVKLISESSDRMAHDPKSSAYHGRYEAKRLRGPLKSMFPRPLYPELYHRSEDVYGGGDVYTLKFGNGHDWSDNGDSN